MSSTLKKWFFRLVKVSALVVAGFVILALLVSTFYAGEMKQLIVTNLNKKLKSPVGVKDIRFSLLRHFPMASVELNDVTAMDAFPGDQRDTLLTARKISLLFNMMALVRKDISVRRVVVNNGSLFVKVDKSGNDNYHIWKTTSGSQSTVDLEKIILDGVTISYEDQFANQHYVLDVKEAGMKCRFEGERMLFAIESEMMAKQLWIDKVNYLADKKVKIDTRLSVNNNTGLYHFEESSLKIAKSEFTFKGDVKDNHDLQGLFTDLVIETKNGNISDCLSMLPEDYSRHFRKYKSRGTFDMKLKLTGGGSKSNARKISVDFTVKNGKLSPLGSSVSLTHLNFHGNYHNNPGKPDELNIPSLSAELDGHSIDAGLRITNFSSPFISLHAKADCDLSRVKPFLVSNNIEALGGDLNLDVTFAGRIKDLKNISAGKYKVAASGSLRIANGSLRLKNNPLDFHGFNGTFSLQDNNLIIQAFGGEISSTDFNMSGIFNNFINYLLLPDQYANLEGRITSRKFNLDELMANKSQSSENDTSYLLKFNPRLVCNFDVSVNDISFRKFNAREVNGMIQLKNQVISSSTLSFHSMKGNVQMNASIDASRRDKVMMACDADITGIDITELFYQMENFGQRTMTDKNLKGRLTADVKFSSDWSTNLVIRPATSRAQCHVMIENGELVGFTPVLALSKYLKVADLNDIHFSTLKNEINIADRKIYIPSMEVNSSALNLTASGVHRFDNIIDYKLKMLLSDVLGRKVKQKNSEFGEIEDDGLGHPKLFLAMTGPADNPKFSFDRKSVGEKIRNDLRADQQNVKQMLKEEFGLFRKDTAQPGKKKVKEELQVDWENNN